MMMKLFKTFINNKKTSNTKLETLKKEQLNVIIGGGDSTEYSKEPRRTVGAGQVTEIIK